MVCGSRLEGVMITNEIVEVARHFHELGGNEGITVMEEGRWYIDIDDRRSPILMTYQTLKIAQSSNVTVDGIPILTESELWELLREKCPIKPVVIRELIAYRGGKKMSKCESKRFYINNLHHALYSAAVWVLEQERKLYNTRDNENANHNIG